MAGQPFEEFLRRARQDYERYVRRTSMTPADVAREVRAAANVVAFLVGEHMER